jgi:predicted transcriptional regulator
MTRKLAPKPTHKPSDVLTDSDWSVFKYMLEYGAEISDMHVAYPDIPFLKGILSVAERELDIQNGYNADDTQMDEEDYYATTRWIASLNLFIMHLQTYIDDLEQNNLPTKRVAELSTWHITPKDCKLLDLYSIETSESTPFIVYKYPEGYFIHCTQDDPASTMQEAINAGFSQLLITVWKRACEEGASYLQIDRDAPESPQLPKYPWT